MGRKVIQFYSGGAMLLFVLIVMFLTLAYVQRATATRVPLVSQAAGGIRAAATGQSNLFGLTGV